jgi:hypothetical protein
VVAVWEYEDRAAYERIERAVSQDPDSVAAQEYRKTLGALFTSREEVFMTSTLLPGSPEAGQKAVVL